MKSNAILMYDVVIWDFSVLVHYIKMPVKNDRHFFILKSILYNGTDV